MASAGRRRKVGLALLATASPGTERLAILPRRPLPLAVQRRCRNRAVNGHSVEVAARTVRDARSWAPGQLGPPCSSNRGPEPSVASSSYGFRNGHTLID